MLELLIKHGASEDINANDALGMTPLACLIRKRDFPGHEPMILYLMEAGAQLELVPGGGRSLMFKDYLTPALAETLLQKGLDIDCTNELQETPLQVAAARGNECLVQFLLTRRANPNKRCLLGGTALHDGELSEAIAYRLLRAGAQVNVRDAEGLTPLMMACDSGNLPLVRLLVQHQASLAATSHLGWTVVDYARNSGVRVYQCLLESAGLIPGTRLANT